MAKDKSSMGSNMTAGLFSASTESIGEDKAPIAEEANSGTPVGAISVASAKTEKKNNSEKILFYCDRRMRQALKECVFRENLNQTQIINEALEWRLGKYLDKPSNE